MEVQSSRAEHSCSAHALFGTEAVNRDRTQLLSLFCKKPDSNRRFLCLRGRDLEVQGKVQGKTP